MTMFKPSSTKQLQRTGDLPVEKTHVVHYASKALLLQVHYMYTTLL
jgi:hypothetical protein